MSLLQIARAVSRASLAAVVVGAWLEIHPSNIRNISQIGI